MDLPPGFRFHPTNEEIITHYLAPKIVNPEGFTATAIAEVDLNRCEPWELPSKAKMRGEEMYFFCHRDRKYPTGSRTNRATESGYWKATGKDKEIYNGRAALVGMKKTLVFYKGRAPKGEKTNWVMHEFRIEGKHSLPKSAKDEWVVCRVFHKNIGVKRTMEPNPSFNVRNDQFFDFGGANIPPTRSQQVNIFNRQLNSSPAAPQNPLFGSQLLVGSNSTADLAGYFLHHQHEPMLTSVVNTAENCFGLQQQQQPHHSPETERNTDISSVLSKQYDDFDETWTSYGF